MYSAIKAYFQNIWLGIVTTLKGMRMTLRYFFSKKVTMMYPEERPVIPEAHRGLHYYEEEKCILCMACVRACPVDCIALQGLGKGKDNLITQYDVDYTKCLFCNLCCEVCPTDCIHLGPDYDLAGFDRESCVSKLARPKKQEELETFKVEYERREQEKKAKAAAAAAAAKAKAASEQK